MIKEIESFLGFTKSYKCFIKNFSHIAKPLNELKGKNEWKWEEEYPISTHSSIQRVERKIISQPVLILSRRKGKFRVETDTSGYTIGGVLSQEQEEKQKPIAFLSRTIQAPKRNYKIYNKEVLAMIEALTKQR